MPKPHLEQLTPHIYYLTKGANCCLIVQDDEAIIFDTGQDKDAGRYLKQACKRLQVSPRAILNSHAHADHYGGNAYLLKNFDIPVYAPHFEASFMQNPMLEPLYLFSGAKPLKELTSKWLLAPMSRVDVTLEAGTLQIGDFTFEIIETSGHAHEHYALRYGDTLLAADALFGKEVLTRYPLPYGQDIGKQIASAEKLRDYSDCQHIIMGHGAPSHDLQGLITANLTTFAEAAETVYQAAKDGSSSEQIMQQVCAAFAIEISDIPRYYLNQGVVLAYLSYLRAEGRLEPRLHKNQLIWAER